jgi:hypothetical protein
MSEKHEVAKMLRAFAVKLASGGQPDRMTVADGQGGITAEHGQFKHDPGEDDLKAGLPADGVVRTSNKPAGAPDRMSTADGQGGITTHPGGFPKDPGEADLKAGLPADGAVRKSAADRINAIRKAIGGGAAVAPAAPATKSANTPTTMPASDLSTDVLAKIASSVLATEEGIHFVHGMFEKQAGEQAARAMIQEAILSAETFDTTGQVKAAAFNDVFEKAAAIHGQLSQIISEDDADCILKTAAIHQEALMELEHPLLKQAYAAGMDDAAALDEAAEGGEGAPPVDEALPMGGEQLTEEQILQLLQEMIASGEISEEDVMAALQASEGAPAQA